METADNVNIHFVRHMVWHSLLFGLTTTLVPLALELVAVVFVDRAKAWAGLNENWPFNLLALAVVFLAGAYIGGVRFSLSRLDSASRLKAGDCDRNQLADILAEVKDGEPSLSDPSKAYLSISCRGALSLLTSMGLIRVRDGRSLPVSPAAQSFIASAVAHLRDGNPYFMGEWPAGTHQPEAKRLIGLLRSIEEYRIATAPKPNPSAARVVRAAIGLIRADFGGEARFLTISTDTWNPGGAWTPVMGMEDPDDKTLADTIRREICEEMRLRQQDITYVRELSIVTDKRISKRVGLFTDYTYSIFAVQLQQTSASVQNFFTKNPKIEIDYSKAVRTHEFSWCTWEELLDSEHLGREMPTVLEGLRSLQFSIIPQTVSLPDTVT